MRQEVVVPLVDTDFALHNISVPQPAILLRFVTAMLDTRLLHVQPQDHGATTLPQKHLRMSKVTL